MATCPVFSKCLLPRFPWNDHYHHHHNNIYRRGTDVGIKYRASKNGRVHNPQKKSTEPGKMEEQKLQSNAHRAKQNSLWSGGFSLGVDLGDARTGVALGKGYAQPRPLSVLQLRGQKLECRLIELAEKEEVDEFIVGLPKSSDGKETPQSNKVRSIAGRLAVRAAERGWRVYLQNEHGTSADALDFMIEIGLKKHARQEQSDAYAAVMLLERYFSMSGCETELIWPKDISLRKRLWKGTSESFFDD